MPDEQALELRLNEIRGSLTALGYTADPDDPDDWVYAIHPEHRLQVNVRALVANEASHGFHTVTHRPSRD